MRSLIFIVLLFHGVCFGQLEVYSTSPTYMENGDLFGPNYQIYDAEFQGSVFSYAQFNGVNSNLGLSRGFVMTTGVVANLEAGILGPNNSANAGVDLPENEVHIFLSQLSGGASLNDASYLSFTLVPLVDSLVFNYSFGSDEYEEYVGAPFNDAVGFFISGPGLLGPTNLLRVNAAHVSVNSVHPYVLNQFGTHSPTNSAYYQNNTTLNTDETRIEYDGFTVNTQARIEGLQVGEEYTVVIAIADAFDGILDSGLFIEACETCVPTLGIAEEVSDWSLWPNPVRNYLTVQTNKAHEYRIVDALGQEVLAGFVDGESHINCASLPASIYFVHLDNGQSQRFVKE